MVFGFAVGTSILADELETVFQTPPRAARPQVLWMWMGGNVSSNGITRDLEALRDAGFGGATMFSLADVCTPWAGIISNCPTPEVVTFTEPWWKLVRHAAGEARRLGLDFGIHNCAGYESSGGPWITPELSMQEVVWSETQVRGRRRISPAHWRRPDRICGAVQPFPVFNPTTGKLEKPEIPARRNFIATSPCWPCRLQACGVAGRCLRSHLQDVGGRPAGLGRPGRRLDHLSLRPHHDGRDAPAVPVGSHRAGVRQDEPRRRRVSHEPHHRRSPASPRRPRRQRVQLLSLRQLRGRHARAGRRRCARSFAARRGYDLTPFLPTLAKRIVGSEAETKKFQDDFQQTIRDLYRENYFPAIERKLHEAGLQVHVRALRRAVGHHGSRAARGPHRDGVLDGRRTLSRLYELAPTVAAVRAAGRNIIEAEAFTGSPGDSQWTETPAWLKPIGDAAFCDGVNRMVLHRFTHQPFDDRWRPGMAMGQWGTHFDRTQTWWEPGKAWVQYLARCQALLQWGEVATAERFRRCGGDREDRPEESIHRRKAGADVYLRRQPGANERGGEMLLRRQRKDSRSCGIPSPADGATCRSLKSRTAGRWCRWNSRRRKAASSSFANPCRPGQNPLTR